MRLIDADALKEELRKMHKTGVVNVEDEILFTIDDAPTASGWVPVEKDLPEPGELVLITCQPKGKAANVNRAWCDKEGVWHGSSTVVAWMPMPEAYKERDDD